MGNPAYVRTTKSRNKMNQRRILPVVPEMGIEVTSDNRQYLLTTDGERIRVRERKMGIG